MSKKEEAKAIAEIQRQWDNRPISTKEASEAYRDGWERTFGKAKPTKERK